VATNGADQTTLLTAAGVVNRCTSLAVDALHGKIFLADAQSKAIFKANLDGSGLTQIGGGLTAFPTDLALDVTNQLVYFTTSSTIQTNNTIQRMAYSGNKLVKLLTAGVGPAAGVARCTAIALDGANGRIFLVDVSGSLWSMTLSGAGVTALATVNGAYPTGLALDSANRQVYFSVSSTVQNSNSIQRVSYGGTGLTSLFTASGSVQRCTALDFDPVTQSIYLSDARANSLWRIPLATGTPAAILSLPATAKKVRWYGSATTPVNYPSPVFTGLRFTGSGSTDRLLSISATNGYSGGTYYLLASTNLAAPLSQWQPVATNILGASGSFSLTLTNPTWLPCQFYLLRVQ
jgi:DNA-binding beta-propeller fold protein YncE